MHVAKPARVIFIPDICIQYSLGQTLLITKKSVAVFFFFNPDGLHNRSVSVHSLQWVKIKIKKKNNDGTEFVNQIVIPFPGII